MKTETYTKNKKFIAQMFDEISPTYDRLNHVLSGMQDKKWRKNAVNYLSTQNAKYENILDLASGSGDLAIEFQRLNPGRLYSADLSFEMLKINKSKVNSHKINSKINSIINLPIQADAEMLPFPDDFFDVIGIGFGVRNFENLQNCITEIYRVMKSGGALLTIEMFKCEKYGLTQKSFKIYFQNILPKLGKMLSNSKYAYDYLFKSVDNFLSVNEYKLLLEDSGFSVIYVKNNFLNIVNTVIAKKK